MWLSDNDWIGPLGDRKSRSNYVFNLGSDAVCWSSKKQSSITLSSLEVEYVVVTSVAYQAIWLRRVLIDVGKCKNMG